MAFEAYTEQVDEAAPEIKARKFECVSYTGTDRTSFIGIRIFPRRKERDTSHLEPEDEFAALMTQKGDNWVKRTFAFIGRQLYFWFYFLPRFIFTEILFRWRSKR